MNTRHLEAFYAVMVCGSISRAADMLHISQPAVSQSMKLLEANLKAKLFLRTSRGIRLTPEGEILFDYVKGGYEQIAHGEQVLQKLMNLEAGELHIGASDMTLEFFLLPFLEKYHEQHPDVKVKISNAPTPETLKNLMDGSVDLCLVSTPFEVLDGMEVRPVREIEDIFVAGRRYTQLKNHMTDFKELLNYPIISLEKNTSTRKYMDELLAQNDVILNPEFELATSNMIVQFALRNLGVGCVVRDFAQPEIDSGRLFEIRFNKMIPKRQICVVTNQKLPTSFAAKGLLELLFETNRS